jgi:hypothetical protein
MSFTVGFSAAQASPAAAFGVQSVSALLSSLDFAVTDASPPTVDAIEPATPLGSGAVPVTGGEPVNVRIPASGSFKGKGFRAGAPGTITLTAGAVDAAVTALPWLDGAALTCQPSSTPLTSIAVT